MTHILICVIPDTFTVKNQLGFHDIWYLIILQTSAKNYETTWTFHEMLQQ